MFIPLAFAPTLFLRVSNAFYFPVAFKLETDFVKGNTYTPMTKEFFGEMSREEMEEKLHQWGLGAKMLEPEDVARVIVWLLSEASMGVNGVNLPVGPGAP